MLRIKTLAKQKKNGGVNPPFHLFYSNSSERIELLTR